MTREEAIYILKNTAWLAPSGDTSVDEAVEIACKALEQPEQCEDAISRQKAIAALNDEIMDRRLDEDAQIYDRLDEFDVENILRKLPFVTLKRKTGTWSKREWADIEEGLLVPNYVCSVCHDWLRHASAFCPSCGAEMREDGDEHTMEEFMCGQELGNPEDGSL